MEKEYWGQKMKEKTKTCTKVVSQKKHAQDGKLQEKHVSKKSMKVLEIKEGTIVKRNMACQLENHEQGGAVSNGGKARQLASRES